LPVKQTCFPDQVPANRDYFGRTDWSPPGLPGGGMTGVLPASGGGARISGSTPAGGQSTPSDRASLSPSGSRAWPVVCPSGAAAPGWAPFSIGAQFCGRSGAGGAVCCAGVDGVGGACASAEPADASTTQEMRSARFICIGTKRPDAANVPATFRLSMILSENRCPLCANAAHRVGIMPRLTICGNGSARSGPSAASDGARRA
jgi:hypothetical protein